MGLVGRRPSTNVEEPEQATRGSRYRRGGAEDDAPRGRNGASAESNGRGSSRRFRGSSEEEDSPRSSRRRGRGGGDEEREQAGPPREQQRGWAGFNRAREETSQFADRFKLSTEFWQLIAFQEDEPFESVARHYIQHLQGQKMFICPGKNGPYKCPICARGDQAMPVAYFNVVVFDEVGRPEAKVWECGPGYAGAIEVQTESRAVNGKLSSVYFEVHGKKAKSGKGSVTLEINVVRERDVEQEWEIKPLTDDEWDDLAKEMKGEGYVQYQPERVLQAAADEMYARGD